MLAHARGALESVRDRLMRYVGSALRVHELFPAPIKEALVVLRDLALGDEPWIIRMAPRMPSAHRQIVGVPAPEAARARFGHLTPIVDVVLLEHTRRTIVGLAADADCAFDLLGHIPLQQHEV